MSSRSLSPLAVGILAVVLAASAPAAAANDAATLVSDLGKRAVIVLTSTGSEADREAQFRKLFEEGFDLEALSRFVLGPYWRSATSLQQQEFETLFRDYEVHSYTVRFNEYSSQQLKVLGSRPEGESGALVQSQIAASEGNAVPVKIDWRVKRTGDDYKITDVVIEGVSMAVTERQQFASVIQRSNGQLEGLLKVLRERAGKS